MDIGLSFLSNRLISLFGLLMERFMSKSTVFYANLSRGIKESFSRDVGLHTSSKPPVSVGYRYTRERLYNGRRLINGFSLTSAIVHRLQDLGILHTRGARRWCRLRRSIDVIITRGRNTWSTSEGGSGHRQGLDFGLLVA